MNDQTIWVHLCSSVAKFRHYVVLTDALIVAHSASTFSPEGPIVYFPTSAGTMKVSA